VVISTNHSAYDYPMIAANAKLVIDSRNAMAKVANRSNIIKA
jgi:UDP-N-acetyl-D-mannosaminuronate dehydrogenase